MEKRDYAIERAQNKAIRDYKDDIKASIAEDQMIMNIIKAK